MNKRELERVLRRERVNNTNLRNCLRDTQHERDVLSRRVAELEAQATITYDVTLRGGLRTFVEADTIGCTTDGFTVFKLNGTITALVPAADIAFVRIDDDEPPD